MPGLPGLPCDACFRDWGPPFQGSPKAFGSAASAYAAASVQVVPSRAAYENTTRSTPTCGTGRYFQDRKSRERQQAVVPRSHDRRGLPLRLHVPVADRPESGAQPVSVGRVWDLDAAGIHGRETVQGRLLPAGTVPVRRLQPVQGPPVPSQLCQSRDVSDSLPAR
ncbi:hypothetical protein ACFRIB_49900 [Streptomyces mirabilis]|uniref:hypothetical protein n=1 Tax=Streptomyces mirabilis TaxID=68239 RepID=UPI003673D11E